ncbi:MAG: flagellar motor protein MotB [Pirellulales bacterium]
MAGGGGAWKVAYADFVTAMMAFFLVMWIVAQNKPIKEAVAQYFNDPFGVSSKSAGTGPNIPVSKGPGTPGGGGVQKGMRNPGPKFPSPNAAMALHDSGKGPGALKPGLVVVHDGDKPSVGTAVQFPEHSAVLDEVGKRRLDEIVPLMMGKPYKVEIRGHSTRRPQAPDGEQQSVWQLSYARCDAVRSHLESRGVLPERFRLSQAGPYEPASPRVGDDWRTQGSRVEVFMLDEIVESLAPSHQRTPKPGPPPQAHGKPPHDEHAGDEHETPEKEQGADHHGDAHANDAAPHDSGHHEETHDKAATEPASHEPHDAHDAPSHEPSAHEPAFGH